MKATTRGNEGNFDQKNFPRVSGRPCLTGRRNSKARLWKEVEDGPVFTADSVGHGKGRKAVGACSSSPPDFGRVWRRSGFS